MANNSIYNQAVAACGSKAAFDKASQRPGAPRKLDSQNDVSWYKANCNQGSASSDIFQQVLNVCGSQSAVDQASKSPGAPKNLNSQNDVDWYRSKCQSNAVADTISTASAPAIRKTSTPSTTTSKTSTSATSTTGSSSSSSNPYVAYAEEVGMTPAEFDLYSQEKLLGLQQGYAYDQQELIGNQQLMLQGLRNEATALTNATSTTNTQLQLDASKYAADAERATREYLGDVDYKTKTDTARIQGQSALDLQDIVGSQQLMLQGLRNEADALTNATSITTTQIEQDAANWRQQYTADSERAMREYLGDVDYKTKTDTAKIEGQYAIDLQDIINAGNKEVESVKGEYNLGVERIRGEYGTDIENIRADYGKYVANANRDASVFGNFVAGFW